MASQAAQSIHKNIIADVRAFTSKHRPTIAEAAVRALEVVVDRTRGFRDVIIIFIATRPGTARTEKSFYATGADVVPFSHFGSKKAEEMKGQLKTFSDQMTKQGSSNHMGTIFAVLSHFVSGYSNICPVSFFTDIVGEFYPGMPWKKWLTERLNEGIVS